MSDPVYIRYMSTHTHTQLAHTMIDANQFVILLMHQIDSSHTCILHKLYSLVMTRCDHIELDVVLCRLTMRQHAYNISRISRIILMLGESRVDGYACENLLLFCRCLSHHTTRCTIPKCVLAFNTPHIVVSEVILSMNSVEVLVRCESNDC